MHPGAAEEDIRQPTVEGIAATSDHAEPPVAHDVELGERRDPERILEAVDTKTVDTDFNADDTLLGSCTL
jgi:hypothetical protein